MQEKQVLEALNTHRHASTAGDANAEHDIGAVRELSHFIDGQRAAVASARFGDVFDPAQGRVAARVPLANAAEVATAVAAAKAAFPAWSETAPLKRARLMFKFKQLLETHHDELAELITRDHGKLFSDAKEPTRALQQWWATCLNNLVENERMSGQQYQKGPVYVECI